MRLFQIVVGFAIGAVTANAAVTPRGTHVLHEKRSSSTSLWVKSTRVDKDAILPIRIGLAQSSLEHGYNYLMDV